MAIEETFGNLFKPEIKSGGRKLVSQEKVSLTNFTDTVIQAYVKVAPPFKVKLTSEINGQIISVDCACPVSKKSRFCKHIWATLLLSETKHPDFFIGKNEIEKQELSPSLHDEKQSAFKESARLRASDYRKEQYQKQADAARLQFLFDSRQK